MKLKKALNMIGNKYETEASGNITEKNITKMKYKYINTVQPKLFL